MTVMVACPRRKTLVELEYLASSLVIKDYILTCKFQKERETPKQHFIFCLIKILLIYTDRLFGLVVSMSDY